MPTAVKTTIRAAQSAIGRQFARTALTLATIAAKTSTSRSISMGDGQGTDGEGDDREHEADDAAGDQERQADGREENGVYDAAPCRMRAVEKEREEQRRDAHPEEMQQHQGDTEQGDLGAVAPHRAQRMAERHGFMRR